MALLSNDLAKKVYQGFKGKLLTGIIRQLVVADSAALDEHGDAQDLAPVDTAIEGFDDEYSEYFRRKFSIPDSDVIVNIFVESAPGITPSEDDRVRFDRSGVSQWFQLRKVKVDPARALWVCGAFRISDPGAE
jgi:hypothetical protein